MRTVSGTFYKSFDVERNRRYWTFLPTELNLLNIRINQDITDLLIQAHRTIGILEGIIRYIPNVEHFLELMICGDAYYSCRIDNIAVHYRDILIGNNNLAEAKSAINCCKAFHSLPERVFTKNNLCNLQNSVMEGIWADGVGMIRDKGFLMRPNVIVNMQEYNPPSPENIDELLLDLIKYIAVDQSVDILIKTALMYYQFETIHPFSSGNGRVGRLLPALLLMKKGILSKGCLFISEYLYKHNDVCLDLFFGVQHFGNYMEWIKFFLQCIIDSSNQAIKRIKEAVDERSKIGKNLQRSAKFSGELSRICDFIETKPVFMINDLVDAFQISYNTASSRVDMLVEMNIVKKDNEQHRNRIFAAQKYIDIFMDSR